MKLDIEAMAREADKDGIGWLLDEGLVHPDELERFARLIVERCAQECEAISDEYGRDEGFRYPSMRTDAQTGASECEYAIRNLLKD